MMMYRVLEVRALLLHVLASGISRTKELGLGENYFTEENYSRHSGKAHGTQYTC